MNTPSSLAPTKIGAPSAVTDCLVAVVLFASTVAILGLLAESPILAVAGVVNFTTVAVLLFPRAAPPFLLLLLLAQNLFIAINLGPGHTQEDLNALQISATATYLFVGVAAYVRIVASGRAGHGFLPWSAFGVALLGYLMVGFIRFGATDAILAFRGVAIFFFSFIIGTVYLNVPEQVHRLWLMTRILRPLLIVWAAAEVFFPGQLYGLINYTRYAGLKFPDAMIYHVGDLLSFVSRPFLNIPGMGGVETYRLSGPNLHPVSFGYVLLFFAALQIVVRRQLDVPILLVLFIAGIKGPLLVFFFAVLACAIFRTRIAPKIRAMLLIFAVISGYSIVFTISYLGGRDLHIIGLLGGISAFLDAPWGDGMGVAGNAVVERDIRLWIRQGVDFGVESAFGVYIHQIGIVFLIAYGWVTRRMYVGLTKALVGGDLAQALILTIAICVMANSIFQEEAFSFHAVGFWGALAGSVVVPLKAAIPNVTPLVLRPKELVF